MSGVAQTSASTQASRGAGTVLCFLDTNILLYAIDDRTPTHQTIALQLIESLAQSKNGVLSTQVLLEFNANLTGKFRVSRNTAALMTAAYADWTVIESDLTLVLRATARSVQQNHSIWDAMIIEAAIRAGAMTLYSEDMQHGQRFDSLTIVNPFLEP